MVSARRRRAGASFLTSRIVSHVWSIVTRSLGDRKRDTHDHTSIGSAGASIGGRSIIEGVELCGAAFASIRSDRDGE